MHGASFLMHKVYTDDVTLKLVGAACEVLGKLEHSGVACKASKTL